MDIKRYDSKTKIERYKNISYPCESMTKREYGDYVKYSDHLQVVKELEDKIESKDELYEC